MTARTHGSRSFALVLFIIMLARALGQTNPANAQSVADIVARLKPAVVFISVIERNGASASGTGFVVAPDGYIITARHVIMGAQRIFVKFLTGTVEQASVVGTTEDTDAALLKIPGSNYPTAQLDVSPVLRQGDQILVLGYPGGRALADDVTVTRGIVSAVRLDGLLIQTDAAINPGNSGGPIVSAEGLVVAVAVARFRGFTGVGFGVSITGTSSLLSRIPGGVPTIQRAPQTGTPPPNPRQHGTWHIVPGASVGPLTLGITPEAAQAILGPPLTTCTEVQTLSPQTTSVLTQLYYPEQGLALTFTGDRGLTHVAISSDKMVSLQNYVDPAGFRHEYSCKGPRPVQLHAQAASVDVAGITLGASETLVYRTFGKSDTPPPIPPGDYHTKGISFDFEAGGVATINVYNKYRLPWDAPP